MARANFRLQNINKSKNVISEIQQLNLDEYTVTENCTVKLIVLNAKTWTHFSN